MLAGVVAREVRERGGKVAVGGGLGVGAGRAGKVWGERPPAPGAGEVEAVEVGDLAVAAVADGGGDEQRGGLFAVDARQEPGKPMSEFFRRQAATQAQGLGQRGGEEFVAARLPGLAIAVAGEFFDLPGSDRLD